MSVVCSALRAVLVTLIATTYSSCANLLKDLNAECTKEGIKVQLAFNQPFYGVAYSLGHYDNILCQYIKQDSSFSGSSNYSFLIPSGSCGTVKGESKGNEGIRSQGTAATGLTIVSASYSRRRKRGARRRNLKQNFSNEVFMENTLLIQQDPSIQESSDLAQKLRCVWHKEIHKPLTAALPINANNRQKITQPTLSERKPIRYSVPELKGGFYGVINPVYAPYRRKGQVQTAQSQHAVNWATSSAPSRSQLEHNRSSSAQTSFMQNIPEPLALVSASTKVGTAETMSVISALAIVIMCIKLFGV